MMSDPPKGVRWSRGGRLRRSVDRDTSGRFCFAGWRTGGWWPGRVPFPQPRLGWAAGIQRQYVYSFATVGTVQRGIRSATKPGQRRATRAVHLERFAFVRRRAHQSPSIEGRANNVRHLPHQESRSAPTVCYLFASRYQFAIPRWEPLVVPFATARPFLRPTGRNGFPSSRTSLGQSSKRPVAEHVGPDTYRM